MHHLIRDGPRFQYSILFIKYDFISEFNDSHLDVLHSCMAFSSTVMSYMRPSQRWYIAFSILLCISNRALRAHVEGTEEEGDPRTAVARVTSDVDAESVGVDVGVDCG